MPELPIDAKGRLICPFGKRNDRDEKDYCYDPDCLDSLPLCVLGHLQISGLSQKIASLENLQEKLSEFDINLAAAVSAQIDALLSQVEVDILTLSQNLRLDPDKLRSSLPQNLKPLRNFDPESF